MTIDVVAVVEEVGVAEGEDPAAVVGVATGRKSADLVDLAEVVVGMVDAAVGMAAVEDETVAGVLGEWGIGMIAPISKMISLAVTFEKFTGTP